MNQGDQTKLNTYFKNRGIDSNYYLSFQLPKYLADELPSDKNAQILDIGCGFGQMLLRLRDNGYTQISGIDIGHESVDFCLSQGLNVEMIQSIEHFAGKNESKFSFLKML